MKKILRKNAIAGLVCLLASFSTTQAQTIIAGGFEEIGPPPPNNNLGDVRYAVGTYTDPAGNFVVGNPVTNPGAIFFSRQYDYYVSKQYFTQGGGCICETDATPIDGTRARVFTYDAVIAMKLSAPLVVGSCYKVNFFVQNNYCESACFGDSQIEFGIPTNLSDLTNTAAVFGNAITAAPISVTAQSIDYTWMPKSFTFTAPSAATYISFRIPPTGGDAIYNALTIDALSLVNTCAPLPVRFINFSAQPEGRTAKLIWSTSMETNSKGFEIQRSHDARSWQILGFVNSKESSSNSRKDYLWSDEMPLEGINYYRLKQVDFDGTVDFSKVIAATLESENKLAVAPNPVTDRIKLRSGTTSSIVGVKLINAAGRTVYQSNSFSTEGIDVSHLPNGVYILRMQQSNGKVQTQKVIKQ